MLHGCSLVYWLSWRAGLPNQVVKLEEGQMVYRHTSLNVDWYGRILLGKGKLMNARLVCLMGQLGCSDLILRQANRLD